MHSGKKAECKLFESISWNALVRGALPRWRGRGDQRDRSTRTLPGPALYGFLL
jgi:hypothetical protein